MLTKVGYYCARLLPQTFWVGTLPVNDPFHNGIPAENQELWKTVCGLNNQAIPLPGDPVANFDPDKWIRQAKFNGGLMMFFFFRDQLNQGAFPPSNTDCDHVLAGAQ